MTGTFHEAAIQWNGSYKIGVKSALEYSAVRIQYVLFLIFLFFNETCEHSTGYDITREGVLLYRISSRV